MKQQVTNPKVDAFLKRTVKWKDEFETLRRIILESPLDEELKWGVPCYAYQKGNVVLMHGFKDYCALLFIKGALLKDPQGILIQQTANVQAGRQLRFTSSQAILNLEPTIIAYLDEAIENEKNGLEIEFKKSNEFIIPDELEAHFIENNVLKSAFEKLTPGRQRAYILFFSAPKYPQTRTDRIEKCVQQILDGKGLND